MPSKPTSIGPGTTHPRADRMREASAHDSGEMKSGSDNSDSLSGDMLRDDPEPDVGGRDADVLLDDSDIETPAGGDVLIDDENDSGHEAPGKKPA